MRTCYHYKHWYWQKNGSVREASIALIVISNKLLLFCNFNDALTYHPFFSFKCCESVVFYISLLDMAHKLSRFCKMAPEVKSIWTTLD